MVGRHSRDNGFPKDHDTVVAELKRLDRYLTMKIQIASDLLPLRTALTEEQQLWLRNLEKSP
ncbi:MAG: hypothetical protein H6545_01675 [Bacteroidales bacterium]|nr:hypothetical protein [Bacteroidales bacterium]